MVGISVTWYEYICIDDRDASRKDARCHCSHWLLTTGGIAIDPGIRKEGRRGVLHVLDAFVFSLQGLCAAWRDETAFRLQCAMLVPLVPTAFLLAHSAVELALLLGSCVLVMMAEMFNSAIERVVDRIGTEAHPLSGQAKDLGSAGVFLAMMIFLIMWVVLGWQNLAA